VIHHSGVPQQRSYMGCPEGHSRPRWDMPCRMNLLLSRSVIFPSASTTRFANRRAFEVPYPTFFRIEHPLQRALSPSSLPRCWCHYFYVKSADAHCVTILVQQPRIVSKKRGICQEKIEHPNPDLQKIDVANHRDLERFLKPRIPDSLIRLCIPYQRYPK
jgi:hypothetical protein